MDGLEDKARNFPGLQYVFKRGQIVEGHLYAIGEKAFEAFAEDRVAVKRQRSIGQTVKGVAAIGKPRAACCGPGKFYRGLDAFGSGIGEKHFFEVRHSCKQPLRQKPSQSRDIHLHKVRKLGIEDLTKRIAHTRMIASQREHAPAAEEVEIFCALAVPQILALAAYKPNIVADGLKHPHHLLVQMARVKPIAVGFVFREQGRNIDAHKAISLAAAKPIWAGCL